MKNNNKKKAKKNEFQIDQKENKFKQILNNAISYFKQNKKVSLPIGIILSIIIITIIIFALFKGTEAKYALNDFYDVYPEEVRKLYTNVVEVSCKGDLYLDVKIDAPATKIQNLNKNILLDYLFSNIDKNDELTESTTKELIVKRAKELFNANVDLTSAINDYQYGEYKYTLSGNKLKRQTSECTSDIKYVSFLYGYSHNKSSLSMDVNISYQKDGKLYALDNRLLGDYDGDLSKLFDLTKSTSFYRFNYVKEGNNYKLDSVAWMNRS